MSKDVFENIDSVRIDPPTEVWSRLEKSLQQDKNRKGFFLLWGALFISILGMGYFFVSQSKTMAQPVKYSEVLQLDNNLHEATSKWLPMDNNEANTYSNSTPNSSINQNVVDEESMEKKSMSLSTSSPKASTQSSPKSSAKSTSALPLNSSSTLSEATSTSSEKSKTTSERQQTANGTKNISHNITVNENITGVTSPEKMNIDIQKNIDQEKVVVSDRTRSNEEKSSIKRGTKLDNEALKSLTPLKCLFIDTKKPLFDAQNDFELIPLVQLEDDYIDLGCDKSFTGGFSFDYFNQNFQDNEYHSFDTNTLQVKRSIGFFTAFQKELNNKWSFETELGVSLLTITGNGGWDYSGNTNLNPTEVSFGSTYSDTYEIQDLFNESSPFPYDNSFTIKSLATYLSLGMDRKLFQGDQWKMTWYGGLKVSLYDKTKMEFFETPIVFNRFFNEFGVSSGPRFTFGDDCGINYFFSPQVDVLYDKGLSPSFTDLNYFLRFKFGLRYSF